MKDALARFAEAYDIVGSCWQWKRSLNGGGYGTFYLNSERMGAHRASHLLFTGPIPERYDIDHLCRNRACVNPDHLEAVTRSENLRRGLGGTYQRNKTHCIRGHAFDAVNTYYEKRGRGCRICREAARIRYRLKESA